jgi:hypothetical protein
MAMSAVSRVLAGLSLVVPRTRSRSKFLHANQKQALHNVCKTLSYPRVPELSWELLHSKHQALTGERWPPAPDHLPEDKYRICTLWSWYG